MEMLNYSCSKTSWKELDNFIKYIKSIRKCSSGFRRIREDPITPNSIDILVKNGWKVKRTGGEYCIFNKEIDSRYFSGEIHLQEGYSDCYERDKALCHEIVHAWYGREHKLLCFPDVRSGELFDLNNAIVEWLGRKIRSNPSILRQAVSKFGLKYYVYDLSSYLAFKKKDENGKLASNEFSSVFMD